MTAPLKVMEVAADIAGVMRGIGQRARAAAKTVFPLIMRAPIGVSQTIFCCSFGIYLSHFRMIGQA